MSFYTGKGDDGTTGLLGKGRVPKDDARIEAIGTLDESSAALGLARASARDPRCGPLLLKAQRDLYHLMAEVASAPENAEQFRFDPERVTWLEAQIDSLAESVKVPAEFILPGDSKAGAALSVARAVVRRAERRLAEEIQRGGISNHELLHYLNRLSSLCFALELYENQSTGKPITLARD